MTSFKRPVTSVQWPVTSAELRCSPATGTGHWPLVNYYSQPRPIDWREEFSNDNPLELEIGFGTGEYIVKLAKQNPRRNFIGIEEDIERIHKTLLKIAEARVANVRLLNIDAHVALQILIKPRSLEKIHCLFPCPWPKRKHIWHRLFSAEFLKLTNSRLRTKGILKVVTDYRPYFEWILEQEPAKAGFEVEEKNVGPQYDTKFERKWLTNGQEKFYEFLFTKKKHQTSSIHKDVPLKKYYFKEFNPREFHFENQTGPVSISFKEMIYDDLKKKAMLRFIVVEEHLVQDFWAEIFWHNEKWCLQAAPGCLVLPTKAVALTLERVYSCTGDTSQSKL